MKYITLLVILAILTSCKSLVQVVETKTTNTEIIDQEYVFENDSVKVTYNFWSRKGSLKFTVFNKMEKPLYISWKKSSYINNTIKRNYWEDEEKSVSDSYTRYNFDKSSERKITNTIKPEKITFIPPKSNFIKNQFFISPMVFKFNYSNIRRTESLIRNNKTIEVKEKTYEKSNTPLFFRNFLSLSYSENFNKEFYVDNEFYISKVIELNSKDFSAYARDPNRPNFSRTNEFGERIVFSPYKSGTKFYIRVAN